MGSVAVASMPNMFGWLHAVAIRLSANLTVTRSVWFSPSSGVNDQKTAKWVHVAFDSPNMFDVTVNPAAREENSMANILGRPVRTGSLTSTHWLAILLVLVTGVIHVYSGIVEGRIPVSLAGVGFIAAIVVFLLDYRRSLLYLVGILYTAVQLPLWYVVKAGEFTTLGYIDKAVQVVLILLLAYLYYTRKRSGTAAQESVTT